MKRCTSTLVAFRVGLGLAVAGLVGCQSSGVVASAPGLSEEGLALYEAWTEPGEGRIRAEGPDDSVLWLAAEPMVTDAEFRRAHLNRTADGGPAVAFEVSERGAAVVLEGTRRHIGSPVAFVWNGKIVSAPLLRGAVSGRLMVRGGTEALPEPELKRIVARINGKPST